MFADLKLALRTLLKSPGYASLAVIALALGIGANTVLFSAINTLFLRPLAYPEPDRLVRVYSVRSPNVASSRRRCRGRASARSATSRKASAIAAQSFTGFTLTGRGDPEQVQARRVTERFFSVLGVRRCLGRAFTAAEDSPGRRRRRAAQSRFLAKAFRRSKTATSWASPLVLDGRPHTVIGVMPSLGFRSTRTRSGRRARSSRKACTADIIQRGTGYLNVVGRLKPGVTPVQAIEQLRVVHARYAAANAGKVDAKTGVARDSAAGGSRGQPAPDVPHAARRCRLRAARRLRQRRQSPPRPLRRPPQGNRHPRRARRVARPHRQSVSHRERPHGR
jgi:hypothetical protein